MAFLDLAAYASKWRGYEYYHEGKVRNCRLVGEDQYEGLVVGSGDAIYQVRIDLKHPRASVCTCPHAAGKQIICKHKAALYFQAFPEQAEDYNQKVIKAVEDAEREQERLENAVVEHVGKMKRAELQDALLQILFDGPEWQFEHFIAEYLGE